MEGRAEPAGRAPSWPLRVSQPSRTIYIPIANPGVGLVAGSDSTPFPIPAAGQIISVELHQVGTTATPSTFRIKVGGGLVGPTITLPAGAGTQVFDPTIGPLAVDVDVLGGIQLHCLTADVAIEDLGGTITLVI